MNSILKSTMKTLTERQQQVLDYIRQQQENEGATPSLREIAGYFGFRSMNAAADHVRALRRKGMVEGVSRRARALQVVEPWRGGGRRRRVVNIPVYGAIPAGFSRERQQESKGCVSIDLEMLGVRSMSRTFALEVRGDSMVGRHIVEGDLVVLEHGLTPRPGDVVAALIDNESTLKTFMMNRGKPYLRAENPRFPNLIPASELVIQGVMVALVRKVGGRMKRED